MTAQTKIRTVISTSRGDVTIRPTCEEDAAAFRELRLEALRTHPEAFGMDYAEALARPIEFWQERARSGAGSERGVTYVAEAGGALVGMTGIFRDEGPKMRHSAIVWGVFVRPNWRGLGIADTLIHACIGRARELGVRLVKLNVVTTNTAAIRCYVRCGFSVYGVEPEVIFCDGVYYDELLMVRRIENPGDFGGVKGKDGGLP
jgi:RimJ/RimL family protein N-acetyltransferase